MKSEPATHGINGRYPQAHFPPQHESLPLMGREICERIVRVVSAFRSDDRVVSQPAVDTTRIRRVADLTYGAAEAYIALGQRMLGETTNSTPTPTSVVRELDQVSEHLLALATHLSRLAAALEQAGPPGSPRQGEFADPRAGS